MGADYSTKETARDKLAATCGKRLGAFGSIFARNMKKIYIFICTEVRVRHTLPRIIIIRTSAWAKTRCSQVLMWCRLCETVSESSESSGMVFGGGVDDGPVAMLFLHHDWWLEAKRRALNPFRACLIRHAAY